MANLASLLKHRGCQRVAPVHIRRPLQQRPRARPLALVRRRLGARRDRLADPRRGALDGADLARPGGPRRRRRDPGGDVAAALRRPGRAAPVAGAAARRRRPRAARGDGAAASAAATPPSRLAPILGFEGGLALLAGGARARAPLRAPPRPPRHPARGPRRHALRPRRGRDQGADRRRRGSASPIIARWVAIIVVCGALAQYTAVAALQRGGAIETIGLMGLVANATQIAGRRPRLRRPPLRRPARDRPPGRAPSRWSASRRCCSRRGPGPLARPWHSRSRRSAGARWLYRRARRGKRLNTQFRSQGPRLSGRCAWRPRSPCSVKAERRRICAGSKGSGDPLR